ncbi:hypothetical protein BH20ACI3_BH20ACI3_19310 [soil metagenome]
MRQSDFDSGMFNVEFIYNPRADTILVVKINPRMSSQFADLFEKVDGINSYSVLLDLAFGEEPQISKGEGRYPVAASCVLRTFENKRVMKLPGDDENGATTTSPPRHKDRGASNGRYEAFTTDARWPKLPLWNHQHRRRQHARDFKYL